MTPSTDLLTIHAFQLNSTEIIDNNKQQIMKLIESYNCFEGDLWAFPECALFRHKTADQCQGESIDSIIIPWFQELAKTYSKWILVGSYFQKISLDKLTNTSVFISPEGHIVDTYDKIHLFDVSVNKTSFCESKQFKAGKKPCIVTLNNFKIGLSICFDIRFPKLYQFYQSQGCHILCIPSSFTASTGKRHWHTLCKARAIENQCIVIAPNQCGIGSNNTNTYGHSLIVDSLGNIMAEGSENTPCVISATISQSSIFSTRKRFPLHQHIQF